MDNFNFALSLNESSVNTNTNLKPFEIHHVKFQEAAINEGTAKATGKHYKNLSLKFANNKGHADLTIFWPNPDEDGIRPERTTPDGHKYLDPSRWDQTKTEITQTLEVINPEGFEEFKKLSAKFKSFDDMVNAFVTLVNKKIGEEVDVKFNGYVNKSGYMQLTFPKLVRINSKTGELYVSDNYIGHGNLGLNTYELRKQAELNNTQPTVMKADPIMDVVSVESDKDDDEDLDFDNL